VLCIDVVVEVGPKPQTGVLPTDMSKKCVSYQC